MVFEYNYFGAPEDLTVLSHYLPSAEVGLLVMCASTLMTIPFWKQLRENRIKHLDTLILLTCTVALLGIYIFSSRWVDEVFVNLEHPYNLFHHGMFSFSPLRMVDGTVEFLYYLLITPFSFTQTTVVQSAFVLGFIVAWLHFFVLWKLLKGKNYVLKLILLLVFTLALPLMYSFSSGFGNGLVSLLLFTCIYYQWNNQPERALFLAVFFPLIRPDALFYSFTVFAIHTLHCRKLPFKHLLASLAASLSYSALVRLFYGHWVPVPVAFKSFKPSMIPLIDWSEVQRRYLEWQLNPFHIAFVVIFVLSWLLLLSPRLKQFRSYGFPLAGIAFLYITLRVGFWWFSFTENRYFIPFELFSIVFPLLLLWECIDSQSRLGADANQVKFRPGVARFFKRFRLPAKAGVAQKQKCPSTPNANLELEFSKSSDLHEASTPASVQATTQKVSVPRTFARPDNIFAKQPWNSIACASVVAIYLGLTYWTYSTTQPKPWISARVDDVGVAGQIVDRIAPENWLISSTEMNTFGFMMHDREVYDFWGYTNPAIAHSKVCNYSKYRYNPNLFMQVKPDLFWFWRIGEQGADYERWLTSANMGKRMNNLGNTLEVLEAYDVFVLSHPSYYQYAISLLIRKDRFAEFQNVLEQRGYQLIVERSLDMKRLEALYNSQQLIEYNCG